MFSTWWRNSCTYHASSNAISVSCFNCYHLKPQRVKLIYIDKREQNWRQVKFLSVFCGRNNKIFAWKPTPNSMNIQSQYLLYWAIIFLLFFLSANCIVDDSLKPVFSPFNEIKRKKKNHKLLRRYSAVFPSEWSACLLTRLEISA